MGVESAAPGTRGSANDNAEEADWPDDSDSDQARDLSPKLMRVGTNRLPPYASGIRQLAQSLANLGIGWRLTGYEINRRFEALRRRTPIKLRGTPEKNFNQARSPGFHPQRPTGSTDTLTCA